MGSDDPTSIDVLLEFHAMWSRDRSAGRVPPLSEYLPRFPGHEELITHEYDECVEAAETAPGDPHKNQLFADRYRLETLLGEGGQGQVWLADEPALKRKVAIKMCGTSFGESVERSKLESEASRSGAIVDRRICRVHTVDVSQGHAYIVMEYVEGRNLAEHFSAREAPFGVADAASIRRVATIMKDIAEGLGLAHEKAIVHRDMKPSNVMIRTDGSPVVLDFGLARDVTSRENVTRPGDRVGTLAYMSPEQLRGENTLLAPASDVFALGVVLYEALTLRHPFQAATEQDRIQKTLMGSAERVRIFNRAVPWPLAVIVETALEIDPKRRYANGKALAADLAAFLEGRPISARPVNLARRARLFTRRYRAALASALAAILIVGLVLGVRHFAERAKDERQRSDLADVEVRLGRYVERGAHLFPTSRARVSELDELCEDVDADVALLPEWRERLEELREQASPAIDTASEQRRRRELEDLGREARNRLQALESEAPIDASSVETTDLAPYSWPKRREAEHARLASVLERLDRESKESRLAWTFAEAEVQQTHDRVRAVIESLDDLMERNENGSSKLEMHARLEFGRALEARLEGEDRDAWEKAIAEIRDVKQRPAYRGLEIQKQFGLLPLGWNSRGFYEFCHLPSGLPRGILDPYALNVPRSIDGIVLILVPGGTFRMGRDQPAPLAAKDKGAEETSKRLHPWSQEEAPSHEIALDPYFISKFEVTQEQWYAFAGENPASMKVGRGFEALDGMVSGPGLPVEQITYDRTALVLAQMGLVLPTEARWECAAGEPVASTGSQGEGSPMLESNLADKALGRIASKRRMRLPYDLDADDGKPFLAPIGAFNRESRFGLRDTFGNVRELCADGYISYAMPPRPRDGLRCAAKGEVVVRGGGYLSLIGQAWPTVRHVVDKNSSSEDVGVRPARELDR